MQSILPWVGIVILFLTGWAVVKKYQVNMVLLFGSAGAYAAACADMLRDWAQIANANDAKAKSSTKKK